MNTKTLKQVMIFIGIGILNTGIDFLVLNILLVLVGTPSTVGYFVIKAVSFVVANVNSYFWNTRFTFSAQRTMSSFGKFFVATGIGFGVNTLVAGLVYHLTVGWGALIAGNAGALVGTIASMVINFVLYKYVVFKND